MSKPLLFLLAAGALSAQTLSFGVKLGSSLTDPGGNVRTSVPYDVGPTVEFRLSDAYAIEGSAIWHHFRSTSQGFFNGSILSGANLVPIATDSQAVYNQMRGNSWEFPVLGKRYFRLHTNRWTPYVGAGLATRTIGYRYDGFVNATSGGVSTSTSFAGNSRSGLGLGTAFEAGLRTRVGRVALLPEVRYTHWFDRESGLNKEDVGVNLGFRF